MRSNVSRSDETRRRLTRRESRETTDFLSSVAVGEQSARGESSARRKRSKACLKMQLLASLFEHIVLVMGFSQ